MILFSIFFSQHLISLFNFMKKLIYYLINLMNLMYNSLNSSPTGYQCMRGRCAVVAWMTSSMVTEAVTGQPAWDEQDKKPHLFLPQAPNSRQSRCKVVPFYLQRRILPTILLSSFVTTDESSLLFPKFCSEPFHRTPSIRAKKVVYILHFKFLHVQCN